MTKKDKILDLNNPPKLNNNLQDNIELIHKKYGNKFKIKYHDTFLPSILRFEKSKFGKGSFYSLRYDSKQRFHEYFPYKINFINRGKLDDSSAYIVNIHKTDKITGTKMMNIIILLLKTIKAKKATLHDGARIDCFGDEMDLSLFKLIEKDMTFYQKFGFKFTLGKNSFLRFEFGNDEQLQRSLLSYLKKFRKIKTEYLKEAYFKMLDMINRIMEQQDYDNVRIKLFHPEKPYNIPIDNNRYKILELVNEIDTLLGIMNKYKKTYLYEIMIETFYHECQQYIKIMDFIINNQVYGIEYKKEKLYFRDVYLFNWIIKIRNGSTFVLDLE